MKSEIKRAMQTVTTLAAVASSAIVGFVPASSAQAAPTDIVLNFDIYGLGTHAQIVDSVLIWTQPSGSISTSNDTWGGTGTFEDHLGNPFDIPIEDFVRYAYYAVYENYEYDSENESFYLESRSLLIGFNSPAAVGQEFSDLFQDFLNDQATTESDLLDMLGAVDPYTHNPSLFNAFYNQIAAQRSDTNALIQTPLQTGETLYLTHFTSGQEVGTLNFTVVPEPASLSLLAIGGGLLLSRRRA